MCVLGKRFCTGHHARGLLLQLAQTLPSLIKCNSGSGQLSHHPASSAFHPFYTSWSRNVLCKTAGCFSCRGLPNWKCRPQTFKTDQKFIVKVGTRAKRYLLTFNYYHSFYSKDGISGVNIQMGMCERYEYTRMPKGETGGEGWGDIVIICLCVYVVCKWDCTFSQYGNIFFLFSFVHIHICVHVFGHVHFYDSACES